MNEKYVNALLGIFKNPYDKRHAISLIREDPDNIKYLKKCHQDDYEVVLECLYQKPCLLSYMSYNIRNNKDIVEEIICIDPKCYKYASDKLKQNKKLANLAIDYDSTNFKHTSDKLKRDPYFCKSAILHDVNNIDHCLLNWGDNMEFIEKILNIYKDSDERLYVKINNIGLDEEKIRKLSHKFPKLKEYT